MNKQMLPMMALALLVTATPALADSDVTAEKATAESSFPKTEWSDDANAKVVELPNIPAITAANTFTVTDSKYGATTSSENNTKAIQAALDAAASAGGGMVVIPAGTFLCGPLQVGNKTVLHLNKGAMLKLLPYGGWNVATDGTNYYPSSGTNGNNLSYKNNNFITNTKNACDIIIEGEDSTQCIIDGQGAPWWKAREDNGDFDRPSLIRFTTGSRFLVRYMKFQNAPGTNVTLGASGKASHFTVHDISIKNPASTLGNGKASHNTDGIPMWGPYINIYDCTIDTGDDNIVTDSNASYVHAWNLTMGAGHGASMGSYTSNMHHVLFENMTFNGTETALRMKTNKDRSGDVYNIIYRNMTINNCSEIPIMLTCDYDNYTEPSKMATSDVTATTPKFHDILFQNIKGNCTYGAQSKAGKRGNTLFIYGRPESYIKDVTFDNVQIDANNGMVLAFCEGIVFKNGCRFSNVKNSSKNIFVQEKASFTGDYYTGIESVEADEKKTAAASDTKTYNMLGQQVSDSAKGLVVKNGVKYIRK